MNSICFLEPSRDIGKFRLHLPARQREAGRSRQIFKRRWAGKICLDCSAFLCPRAKGRRGDPGKFSKEEGLAKFAWSALPSLAHAPQGGGAIQANFQKKKGWQNLPGLARLPLPTRQRKAGRCRQILTKKGSGNICLHCPAFLCPRAKRRRAVQAIFQKRKRWQNLPGLPRLPLPTRKSLGICCGFLKDFLGIS